MTQNKTTRRLVQAGLIAALYTVLSLAFAPLSFGAVQCRVAEALTVLAAEIPAAIPGLAVGCAVTNLIGLGTGGNILGALDLLIGPLATLAAAWLSYRWRGRRIGGTPVLSTLPPVVLNALAVGTELALVSPRFSVAVWGIQVALVAAGQAVACIGGGLLLDRAWRSFGGKLD